MYFNDPTRTTGATNASDDNATVSENSRGGGGVATPDNAGLPTVGLPKGGGAIKGIDEKFGVNAASGTSSFSIAIPFTSSRNGNTPSIGLSYNSGGGNGPYGIGWQVGLPAIT